MNDESKKMRVRFAPSPTGYLHIGNVRTALFNWLFARKSEGAFILRIEDTDAERSKEEYVESIIQDLYRFGINWDEGPDIGGSFGPYRQSQRLNIYQKHLDFLKQKGLAYECFCQPDELESMRKEFLTSGKSNMYDGRCFSLTEQQKQKLREQGKKPSIRFRVEKKEIVVRDLIRGDVHFDTATIGDFVIQKSDGMPSFHFAVAADDGEMQITHVIRGEDHLPNTPKHILIMEALGFTPPQYAHLPMILGGDNAPLSKRHGDVSLRVFLSSGYLPEALMNHIALLGWASGDNQEIFTPFELIKKFELGHVKKSPAIFDNKKLDWISMQHIKNLSDAKLAQLAIPCLKTEATIEKRHVSESEFEYLTRVVKVLRPYMSKIRDILIYADIFLSDEVKYEDDARALLQKQESKKVISSLIENFPAEELDENTFKALLDKVKKLTGIKGKELFMPLRAALTGRLSGPELVEVFPLLPKNTLLQRLKSAESM